MGVGEQNSAEVLAGRVDALSAMVKGLLTTLVMRGVLTRADIPTLVKEIEGVIGGNAAAAAELRSIQSDLPSYLRAAIGPPPDPDEDHDD